MGAQFIINTEGARKVERSLLGLQHGFGDLTPLMDSIGLTLEGSAIDRFEKEQAPDGTPWAPSIRAKEEGGKTLTDSSRLRSSITSNPSASSVEVGTNVIYGGAHQDGITITAKTERGLAFSLPGDLGFRRVMQVELPARPFLGLSSDDEAELLAQTEDYAVDAAGGEI